ncbi:MAG TPA: methyltransferase domain-containing protein [Candidatus Saccharimonadales bacterium]
MTIQCPICQCQQGTFEVFECDCQFVAIEGLDQHLVRHKCPDCGVIFGTQQMLNLTKEELSSAYQKLFDTGHRDPGEITVNAEVNDLLALNPTKEGIYLNWGAQESTAPDKAKNLGFSLYNYDPFITSTLSSNYLNTEQIKQMKFDGIISHNLLEHFQNPIEDLKFMASLLKPNASMIHSTECYKYLHAQTKYHLFFFEGKSLDIICDKAGLTYEYIGPWDVKYHIKKEK